MYTTPQTTKDKIIELAPTMNKAQIARRLKISAGTVASVILSDKTIKQQALEILQNKLKAEHIDLDADIELELRTIYKPYDDPEKVKSDLLDEFAEATGIVLTGNNDSINNKSEFLDFLKTEIHELY
jgi:hypothetical protein